MLPWKTIIKIDRNSEMPVYLQVANSIIGEIKRGTIKPGLKMPGTRTISEALSLHRQTVVKAYDELYAQGWLVSQQSEGTFINEHLPEVTPRSLIQKENETSPLLKAGFSFKINPAIHTPAKPNRTIIGFHDGPDVRLVPVDLITRSYKSILQRKVNLHLLSYIETGGKQDVRNAIADYLNTSRGLQVNDENIFISRGTQMAMFLLAMILIAKNDNVILGKTNFRYADLVFSNAGSNIIRVNVDDDGIDTDEIEKLCRRKKIRAVYVTSHHHYPTTVTLSAARRMKLLSLSEQYGFIIIEDDYDYEFHYESSPILPLASADRKGMVIYIGSFSKTLYPGIRVGYVSAPSNLIAELCKVRQIVDVQGDPVMEQVVAELLIGGEIRRHMKKALKEYHARRDFMCEILKDRFSDVIDFKIPDGGISIWAKFDKSVNLVDLAQRLRKKDLIISNGLIHDNAQTKKMNATRMGFGWMNMKEAERALEVLLATIHSS